MTGRQPTVNITICPNGSMSRRPRSNGTQHPFAETSGVYPPETDSRTTREPPQSWNFVDLAITCLQFRCSGTQVSVVPICWGNVYQDLQIISYILCETHARREEGIKFLLVFTHRSTSRLAQQVERSRILRRLSFVTYWLCQCLFIKWHISQYLLCVHSVLLNYQSCAIVVGPCACHS